MENRELNRVKGKLRAKTLDLLSLVCRVCNKSSYDVSSPCHLDPNLIQLKKKKPSRVSNLKTVSNNIM